MPLALIAAIPVWPWPSAGARGLGALDRSAVLRNGLGDAFLSACLKLKHEDWNAYARHLTSWERETTLDC